MFADCCYAILYIVPLYLVHYCTDTTYSNFTAATAQAAGASGLVVAPPAGAQGKFLRGDATWVSETTYSTFTGADGTNAGTSGLVPAPTATDNVKFLKGDGRMWWYELWDNIKKKSKIEFS